MNERKDNLCAVYFELIADVEEEQGVFQHSQILRSEQHDCVSGIHGTQGYVVYHGGKVDHRVAVQIAQ